MANPRSPAIIPAHGLDPAARLTLAALIDRIIPAK